MRWREFALLLCGIAAIYLPLSLFPAPDVRIFLIPWVEHIQAAGQIGAFAHPFSNYSPPYLYLLTAVSFLPGFAAVKLLSIIGVVWLAWCVGRLAKSLGSDPLPAAALTLILPTVVLNGPVLGQCDTFWVGCCILAVSETDRPYRMAAWAGLAFAFKAQAAFLAPFCIWSIARNRPWPAIAVPPLIYLLALVPAALAGWPWSDLVTIYLRQSQFAFIGDAPNLWAIPHAFGVNGPDIFPLGYILGGGAALAIPFLKKRDALSVALLAALAIPFFVPKMMERYFLLADVLSLVIAYSRRDRLSIAVAVLIQTGSALSIIAYLAQLPWLNAGASVAMALGLILPLNDNNNTVAATATKPRRSARQTAPTATATAADRSRAASSAE